VEISINQLMHSALRRNKKSALRPFYYISIEYPDVPFPKF